MKKKRGRPPKPKGQQRSLTRSISFSASELDEVETAAHGTVLGRWLREVVLHAARAANAKREKP